MTYQDLRKQQEQTLTDFPCTFAFSEEQLKDALVKLNATKEEVCAGPHGMILKTADTEKLNEMFAKFTRDEVEFLADDTNLHNALMYELGNHEYGYTYEVEPTLGALGIDSDNITDRQAKIVKQACGEFLDQCEDY